MFTNFIWKQSRSRYSVPNLAVKRPKGRTLGVKAEFSHSEPRHIGYIPGKSPRKSHGGFGGYWGFSTSHYGLPLDAKIGLIGVTNK